MTIFLFFSNISFQIPIGITFASLLIWKIVDKLDSDKKNKENLKKIGKKDRNNKADNIKDSKSDNKWIFVILTIELLILIIVGCIFYQYSPVKSLENINGLNYLTSYTYDSFIVFDKNIKYIDSSCLTNFISVFPIAILIGVVYIFKDDNEHLNFFMITVIISILELLLLISNINIAFLPKYILVLGFNLIQIFMIIYIFSRVEDKLFSLTKSAYISIIGLVIMMFLPKPTGLNRSFTDLSYIIFVLESYIILNYSDRRFWRLASWVFTIICLFEFIGYSIVKFV